MKVACYMRVSTNLQNVESQRSMLENYVREKGWEADYFQEIESTRKTRPVKASLLQKLRNREYAGCIVTKLDRFARSSRELILDIDELIKKEIFFISIGDNLDFGTASGMLHFHILCAFSQFERSLISDRTRLSLNRLKQIGKRLGRPPGSSDKQKRKTSGYILKEAMKRKKSDEAKGVNLMIEHYLEPKSKKTSPK